MAIDHIVIKIILVLIVSASNTLYGQKMVTDRPDQTESSSVVPKGSLQIESGLMLGFSEVDDVSDRTILAPTSLFRLGIINGVELRLVNQLESYRIDNSSIKINGISDIEFGFKIELLQKEYINTQIAFISHLSVPSGTQELTNDKVGVINKIAFSNEVNEKLGLGYNIGYNYLGEGDGDFVYSLALGYGFNSKLGLFIETYGEMVDFNKNHLNIDTGLTYLLNENFQLDFSFGTGVNYNMNYIAVGFSWNIKADE